MKLHTILFVTSFLLVSFLYSEVSVFNAGNLDSKNPYGLTKDEEIILKNRQIVDNLNNKLTALQQKLDSMSELLDGVRSVLESNSKRVNDIQKRMDDIELRLHVNNDNNSTLISNLNDLKDYAFNTRAIGEKNYSSITQALKELGSIVDSINSNYVSKSSPNVLSDFANKNPREVMSIADKLYKSGDYDKAKSYYEYLLAIKHRPAYSNFILGEIAYFKKMYDLAIKYYSESISLYDKGDYTPKLLYHTAISFDKLKDRKNANKFYKVLLENYPNSKEAKASPIRK